MRFYLKYQVKSHGMMRLTNKTLTTLTSRQAKIPTSLVGPRQNEVGIQRYIFSATRRKPN